MSKRRDHVFVGCAVSNTCGEGIAVAGHHIAWPAALDAVMEVMILAVAIQIQQAATVLM